MLTQTWTDILEICQRCPSPHNVQPWKVSINSGSSCTVYIDNTRTLPKEDVTGSFILSGMAMYLEMMRYAAEICGYELSYEITSKTLMYAEVLTAFAQVTIRPNPEVRPTYAKDIIYKRRTSRLGHTEVVISDDIHKTLASGVALFGHHYGHTEDANTIQHILDRNVTALFEDLNKSTYHDEIVSWFRYSRWSSRAHHDGLDARCMQMNPAEYYLSAKIPQIFKINVLSNLLRKRYLKILDQTSCFAWISGQFWEPDQAIEAGKLLIKFWLDLTEYDLYIHPFGNLITNQQARTFTESEIGVDNLWFVFRIGYTKTPPESYRRPIKEILI